MTAQLKGILFDFDDTLIDWSGVTRTWYDIETERMTGLLEFIQTEVHASEIDLDALVQRYLLHTKEAWAQARSTLRAPIMPDILWQTLLDLGIPESKMELEALLHAYNWKIIDGTVVFPDVPPMLTELIDNDIRVGIVTNAAQPMTMRDIEVEMHELMPYFPLCRISAADAGYLKPHPRIFEYALELLGTKPEETVFIGDNPVADVAGAQAVGMQAILRVKKSAPPMISGLVVPDAAINSLMELPQILDSWYPGWRNVN